MTNQTISQTGDVWLLGNHKLICGDNSDQTAIKRLMGDETANLVFTSPPYGNQRHYTTKGISNWNNLMQCAFRNVPANDNTQILVNLGLIYFDKEWQPYWAD